MGSGQTSRDIDQVTAQGRPARGAVTGPGQGRGGAQQIVGDRGADGPGTVGAEAPGGNVGQGAVDEVGEGGFDDGVAAVGDVGVGGRLGGVGENG